MEYHYIKVGYSNSLLPFTKYCRPRQTQADHGLWLGFGSEHVDSISDDKASADLRALVEATSSANLSHSMFFAFGRHHLYFFRPLGKPEMASEDTLSKLIEDIEKASGHYASDQAKLCHSTEKGKAWDAVVRGKTEHGDHGSKIVPVELVATFERSQLLPTANSLGVYQYFSRGTFKPLKRIGKDRQDLLDSILRGPSDQLLKDERWYGFFFRKYFDWLLNAGSSERFDGYLKSDVEKSRRLLFATMNPIQLEAAASLMCMDLGLIVDFFTANALDVIDVRARVELDSGDLSRTEQIAGLIKDLSEIMGCPLAAEVRNKLERTGCVDFQCKASVTDAGLVPQDVLLFHPTNQLAQGKTAGKEITLQNLNEHFRKDSDAGRILGSRGNHLRRWIAQMEQTFFSKPRPGEGF